MQELIEVSFSPVNAFFSIMSILMLVYWILVIVAGLDPDLFSVDFESSEVPSNFDGDTYDIPDRAEVSDSSDFLKFLKFFNFDELPLMFILTIIFFTMWFISVNLTAFFGIESTLIGFLLLIPNFIVSLFVVKLFSRPLAYFYRQFNHQGEPEIDFLGRRCKVISSIEPFKTGQVELLVNGDPMKIYARSNTEERLTAGQQAVIVAESPDKKFYLVEKFDY